MMNDPIYASRAAQAIPGINRGWMLALGVLMIVLGLIGLRSTYSFAVQILLWSGILAMIAGVGHLIDAFYQKAWRSVAWHVVVGAVYIFIGFLLVVMPVTSAFWLTKYIAFALVITGIMRFVTMIQLHGQRGLQLLLLFSACVAIGLGMYIYLLVATPGAEVFATAEAHSAWVRSWKWVIGLFVAIELITEGIALISISLSAKSAREG
jgi:uncharacterized membrane protein HdeD (DUF308 family)